MGHTYLDSWLSLAFFLLYLHFMSFFRTCLLSFRRASCLLFFCVSRFFLGVCLCVFLFFSRDSADATASCQSSSNWGHSRTLCGPSLLIQCHTWTQISLLSLPYLTVCFCADQVEMLSQPLGSSAKRSHIFTYRKGCIILSISLKSTICSVSTSSAHLLLTVMLGSDLDVLLF